MFAKIISFLMSILMFLLGLFHGGNPDVQKSFTNLMYGDDPYRQVLDLELPEEDGSVGLILFIHGGAWIFGGKGGYQNSLKAWAKKGYAAAAINYRYISDAVHMTDELNDIDAALKKIKDTAAAQGNPITKVLLTGTSAGGHLSLLYAYARKDTAPITPGAVVSFCGPTDLTRSDFLENNALSDTAGMIDLMRKASGVSITAEDYLAKGGNYDTFMRALREVSPVNYVSAACVPTVFAQGEADTVVPFAGVQALSDALTACGVTNQLVSYPHSGHDLADDPACAAQVDALFAQYAATYLLDGIAA